MSSLASTSSSPDGAVFAYLRLALMSLAVMLAVGLGHGAAQANVSENAIAAARTLRAWQFTDARGRIETLVAKAPKTKTSRYLQAELDFFDGKYASVVHGLEGLDDDDVEGNVGSLRDLAASSLQVTKGFTSEVSAGGHFRIFYGPGKDKAIVGLTGDVLEAAYEALGDDLGHRPDHQIRVELLGKASDLAMVSTLTEAEIETTGTIALCKYGKLMVVSPRATLFGYPWMDTLTHEYVHYIVTQISHDKVPVWLHEGLARYLQVRWRGKADGKLTSYYEHLLSEALKKNKLIGFDKMHPSMAKLPSQEAAALAFAEVSTMVAYVHQSIGEDGLQRALKAIRQGTGARKAVAQAMNTQWDELERDWIRNLKSAKLQSKRFAERARRVRFRKGKGDANNVGVEAIANKKAEKYTRLGGMLRASGKPAAAAVEYEKALKHSGPGDPLIGAKLSRVYLELGRHQEAIALAKPLLALDEMDPVPPTTLGAARLAISDYAGASVAFELALRISPFDSQVRCGLAESYEQLKHKAASRERVACEYLQQVR
ncbi:MAG: tetratricopeptide repeat protein [Myxococcales bacterium]|nr:tetratricopeptide repeat protein [Myxococcales bacterium]